MNVESYEEDLSFKEPILSSNAISRGNPTSLNAKKPALRRISQADPRKRRQARLYAGLKERPLPGLRQEEVEAQFDKMPSRYWGRVTKSELVWGLDTIHSFIEKRAASPVKDAVVVADWWHCPERGCAKVVICACDRPGLLAKIAAAFSALRVDILRADIYTRADGIALDFFEVRDLDHSQSPNSTRVNHLSFLLEGALSDPPRFVSLWASQFHKVVPRGFYVAPKVTFDNESSVETTLVRVEASDRLGFLYDVLQAMTECSVNIVQAAVETEDDVASDVFYVTDLMGKRILDLPRLNKIRIAIVKALVC